MRTRTPLAGGLGLARLNAPPRVGRGASLRLGIPQPKLLPASYLRSLSSTQSIGDL